MLIWVFYRKKKKSFFLSIHIYIDMVWDIAYINSLCFDRPATVTFGIKSQ